MQRQVSQGIRAFLIITATTCVVLAALSCATAPPVQTEGDVRAVMSLAASGESEVLIEQSHAPFLFDGELLVRDQDIGDMWRLVIGAGLFDEGAAVVSITDAGPESYALFAEMKQVELFFSRYVSENARAAVIDTPSATVTLLLDGKSEGYSRIAGMRVDVR
jgi:hypothetical protein